MKICVISSAVLTCPPPGYSGLEMIAWLIAKGLAVKGHIVSLVAPIGSSCPGVDLLACGPAGQWDERNAFREYKGALAFFDVIIDHSWQARSFLLKTEGKLNCPILRVHHSIVDTMYGTQWSRPELPPVEKPCPVCISQDQANHFEEIFRRPAKVAYNGIDLDFYKPLTVPRTNKFLFLARFSSIKGADLALAAAKRADVEIDCIGDVDLTGEPAYFQYCKSMTDAKRRIVGPAKRGECVWWFSQANAMTHPVMRFREPFGLAPVEAQACGCPVIAWDNGAMRETVKHGDTGYLVKNEQDLYDAMIAFAIAPPIKSIRDHCREWASQFSVQRMVDRYEQLCQEAVDTGGW